MSAEKEYENHLSDKEARWFAVYTSYKREKIALRQLQRKGIVAYVPIQKLTRRYSRKIKHVELPLISGYVFVKITKKEYVRVLETEYVIKFISFSKNLLSIPEEEIGLMKMVLGEGLEVNAEKTQFYEGDLVEIAAGNLTGLKGKLVSLEGKNQVLIDLAYLGYTLQINIDPSLLRKLNANSAELDNL